MRSLMERHRSTLRSIYENGEGSIKVQGEWKLEEVGKGKQQIVVTSIPYGVDKGQLENAIGAIIELIPLAVIVLGMSMTERANAPRAPAAPAPRYAPAPRPCQSPSVR